MLECPLVARARPFQPPHLGRALAAWVRHVRQITNDGLFGQDFLPTRFYEVKPDSRCPSFKQRELTDAHILSFTLLCVRLMYIAGEIEATEFSDIRTIAFRKAIITEQGPDFAPLCVYFRLSPDEKEALIVDFEVLDPLEQSVVLVPAVADVFRADFRETLKKKKG